MQLYCDRCITALLCKPHCSSPHLSLTSKNKDFFQVSVLSLTQKNIAHLNTLRSAGLKICCEDTAFSRSAVNTLPFPNLL